MSNKHYNKEYFELRDHVDLHLAWSIKIFMKEFGLKSVLDIGCGTGRLVEFLNKNGFEAVGCDNQDAAIKIAKKINKKGSIIKASATNLPFKKDSFDLVTAISLIEHLTRLETNKFITEAKRVLKPKGFIFLVTPNYSTPIRYIHGKKWFAFSDPTHKIFYTPKTLSQLLKKHGFENIKLRFKINKNVRFNWHLPRIFHKLPFFFQYLLTYLLISSPLSIIRNSFWIAAQKPCTIRDWVR